MSDAAAFGGTGDFGVDGGRWPVQPGTRIVFLLDARDRFEARLLERWAVEASAGQDIDASFIRLGTRQTQARLASMLGDAWVEEDDPTTVPQVWFQPLRIAWLSQPRAPGGGFFRDLFHGRMTEPSYLRRRYIASREPSRVRYIAGAGAWTTEIHGSYRAARDRAGSTRRPGGFASWLQEQAVLVLELAERVERGARYKIPRLLPNKVFADQRFQEQMREIADTENMELSRVLGRGGRYLHEMAASQTPTTIDMITALYRASVRSSHDPRIDVPQEQLARLAELMRDVPVIFLISHKSMLDTAAFSLVLFNANLPIPLTFGGINLSTFGIGSFARRAGIIFLRRSFQDNPIYKAVFRRYIDYLIEKRFSLLWALEGTRSRTGKLLKPRFGLFNYVVDSILRTRLLGTVFVPVSVAYDQITEVEDYAIEQRGSTKKAEGAGWMLRFFRPRAPHGRIFVRMGAPITLEDLGENAAGAVNGQTDAGEADDEARSLAARTMAFETALRMNAATPVTANAIVTSILLERGNRALTLAEIAAYARAAIGLYERRGVELVGLAELADPPSLQATVGALHETGLVQYFDEGVERLYSIASDGHHKAAYYRNSAVHHFLVDGLTEVGLLVAAAGAGGERSGRERFVAAAVRLRGVLKFEFYFARKPRFIEQMLATADERFAGWEVILDEASSQAAPAMRERVGAAEPLVAHWVLRSFVDAYVVAFDKLVALDDEAAPKAAEFAADCLKLGRQQLQQGGIHTAESVSKTLYLTAFELAAHRGLTEAGCGAERADVAAFMAGCLRALDDIAGLAVAVRTRP